MKANCLALKKKRKTCFLKRFSIAATFPCYWPLDLRTLNWSSFYTPSFHSPILKHFSRPLFIYIAASSPRLLKHCFPHISPLLFLSLPLCQWGHPGSLGPFECIISSKRYPSALTSALAGCLPSQLNGLINPSWFLDGLDFIVSYSPLSSCSSLFLNVILSDFNMSAFFGAHSVWLYWAAARISVQNSRCCPQVFVETPEMWAFVCYLYKCVVNEQVDGSLFISLGLS